MPLILRVSKRGSAEPTQADSAWGRYVAHTQSQQERECRGRKPFAGARGVLAPPPLLAAAGGK